MRDHILSSEDWETDNRDFNETWIRNKKTGQVIVVTRQEVIDLLINFYENNPNTLWRVGDPIPKYEVVVHKDGKGLP